VEPKSEFEKAGEQGEGGFFSDLWWFLRDNKKWWLVPILVVLLALALLAVLAGTPLAPFIYTVF
jgi:hypothetical protein